MYSLNDPSGAFEINPHTGSLTMKEASRFDREKFQNGYIDLVIGTLELQPSLVPVDEQRAKSTVKVRIDVKDDNDNSPIFLPSMCLEFSLKIEFLLPT